jgi:hypothetical protein
MKRLAFGFALFFIITGAGGFIPGLDHDGLLFGIFATNRVHNLIHVASGVLGLVMALGTEGFAQKYFRIVGVVYGVFTAMAFLEGNQAMLLGMAMNRADTLLDLVLALASLVLGFLWPPDIGKYEKSAGA